MKYVKTHIKNLERVRPIQGRKDYLRLDMNENPSGLPKDFFEKVINEVTPEMLSMYPEPEKLINLISKKENLKLENITITNGSDDAIKNIFEVFSEEKTRMVTVYPTFAMYMVYAKMYNMETEIINYNEDLTLDANDIIKAINKNTSIVVLLNPNNPIGNVYSDDEVRKIVLRAREVGAIVIIDEAYYYFYNKTYASLIKKYDNVIITRTFSKLCSIAGLRIGYILADEKLINQIEKIKQTFNVNSIGLLFAEKILEDHNIIQDLIETELEGRNYIIDNLQKNEIDYYHSNGNYVFIKCKTDISKMYEQLYNKKILVKTYTNDLLKKYIRISTGELKIMKKFWEAFIEIERSGR